MIIGGLLTVAPVFGPLGKTLHYLADFIAERPQPMGVPDISFFAEVLALIVCPFGLVMFAISLSTHSATPSKLDRFKRSNCSCGFRSLPS
jgi:hypothetical protein